METPSITVKKINKGRFKKGSTPWNKGLKGIDVGGRSKQTRFKKGTIPKNHRPVGSIRTNVEGYLEIKTEEGMYKWRLLHREIWKQHHGAYPPKGSVIIFKDGNKTNCQIDNLQLLTREQLMQRNTIHNLPESIKNVIALNRSITLFINRHGQKT